MHAPKTNSLHRAVYVLPAALHEWICQYQERCGLASEVEAARRLLSMSLQREETFSDVLNRLTGRFRAHATIRELASEVLATHVLVDSIEFGNALEFTMRGRRGKIDADGCAWVFSEDDQIGWHPHVAHGSKAA